MHLARLWREGFPERQLVALSAELRRSGLLIKNTRDSPFLSIMNYKEVYIDGKLNFEKDRCFYV